MDRLTPEGRGSSLSPISISDNGDDPARVPLLSPLTSSEGLGGSHVTIDMSDGESKPTKSKAKRKDTSSSSFSSFLHRFTSLGRLSGDLKQHDDHRHERGDALLEEEETVLIERPDTLQIPDEEQWFESRTTFDPNFFSSGGWTTAMEPRMVSMIDETRSNTLTPHPFVVRSESNEHVQTSLDQLLEDFRNGRLGGIAKDQLAAMDATRKAHEAITDMHRQLAGEEANDEREELALRESYNRMYDLLDHVHDHLIPMHVDQ